MSLQQLFPSWCLLSVLQLQLPEFLVSIANGKFGSQFMGIKISAHLEGSTLKTLGLAEPIEICNMKYVFIYMYPSSSKYTTVLNVYLI